MDWICAHLPSPGTAFGFAALVIALGGVAFAAIPDSNGTIHGCYTKGNGNLRVVESENDCRSSEAAIEWNREGRPGPPGANVVARLRGGPVVATEPGTKPVPLSPSSWSQQANEFQEVHIEVRANVLCELRVIVRLDGEALESFFLRSIDFVDSSEARIFEPGAPATHTLTADVTPTSFCGETRRGGTLEWLKVDVIGFS